MVVFDASILLLVLDENARASGPHARARVEYLIETLSKTGEKIIIPTPALSECLVHAGRAGAAYLDIISQQNCFRVASFDQRAAVEAAVRTHDALRQGHSSGSRTKVKFDRQIVAIAVVEGATAVYSDDADVIAYAREAGMEGYRLADLQLPPQSELDFERP
jgi:predicted nucleic acid-binding protein